MGECFLILVIDGGGGESLIWIMGGFFNKFNLGVKGGQCAENPAQHVHTHDALWVCLLNAYFAVQMCSVVHFERPSSTSRKTKISLEEC